VQWPKNTSDPAYDALVLSVITAGNFAHTFVPITIGNGVFQVSADALKIDGVRINASATLQQHIADLLGAYLPTPKIFDQMWAQRAVTVLPCTQPASFSTEAMIKHSACIDAQLVKLAPTAGIVQTVGKTWALSNKLSPTVAMNIGWHLEKPIPGIPFDPAPTLSGAHMIQSPGTRHNAQHSDYSQIVLLVSRNCTVDGRTTTFASVAQDPSLAGLVSHEGVLKFLRQPGVTEVVTPPRREVAVVKPIGPATMAFMSVGATAGAMMGGPKGAAVGGVVGLAADAIRRRLV
jgi:hypothetical protein